MNPAEEDLTWLQRSIAEYLVAEIKQREAEYMRRIVAGNDGALEQYLKDGSMRLLNARSQ